MMLSHSQILFFQTLLRTGKIARDVIQRAIGFAQLVQLVGSAGREADGRHTREPSAPIFARQVVSVIVLLAIALSPLLVI